MPGPIPGSPVTRLTSLKAPLQASHTPWAGAQNSRACPRYPHNDQNTAGIWQIILKRVFKHIILYVLLILSISILGWIRNDFAVRNKTELFIQDNNFRPKGDFCWKINISYRYELFAINIQIKHRNAYIRYNKAYTNYLTYNIIYYI